MLVLEVWTRKSIAMQASWMWNIDRLVAFNCGKKLQSASSHLRRPKERTGGMILSPCIEMSTVLKWSLLDFSSVLTNNTEWLELCPAVRISVLYPRTCLPQHIKQFDEFLAWHPGTHVRASLATTIQFCPYILHCSNWCISRIDSYQSLSLTA